MFSAGVAAVKCSPVLNHCVVIYFLVLWDFLFMLFTFENRAPSLGDVSGVASFIGIDEQLQLNRGSYFPYADYASLYF